MSASDLLVTDGDSMYSTVLISFTNVEALLFAFAMQIRQDLE